MERKDTSQEIVWKYGDKEGEMEAETEIHVAPEEEEVIQDPGLDLDRQDVARVAGQDHRKETEPDQDQSRRSEAEVDKIQIRPGNQKKKGSHR